MELLKRLRCRCFFHDDFSCNLMPQVDECGEKTEIFVLWQQNKMANYWLLLLYKTDDLVGSSKAGFNVMSQFCVTPFLSQRKTFPPKSPGTLNYSHTQRMAANWINRIDNSHILAGLLLGRVQSFRSSLVQLYWLYCTFLTKQEV